MWLFAMMWCVLAAFSGYAKDTGEVSGTDGARVFDMAGLFSDEEEQKIQAEIENCQKQWNLDVVVVTAEDAEGKNSTAYADDFYDTGEFGQGSGKDGILFLIDMDNRELTFSTCGKAIRIFTDVRIENMLDGVYEGASKGDYMSCADSFLSNVERYCRAGIPGGQYNYDTETGKVSVHRSIRWYEALIAIGVAAFTAGFACLGVKRRYGMEEKPEQIRNLNMAYRSESKFAYDNRDDRLINQFVTSRVIPRSTGSSRGGGGSFSSSGRSSTHTSSGGRSHGGGSRKF